MVGPGRGNRVSKKPYCQAVGVGNYFCRNLHLQLLVL